MTRLPEATLISMMRLRWNSQMLRRQLTASRGAPTKRRLRASSKAGVKSTLCYLASALKCWLTRWSKTRIRWPLALVSHLTQTLLFKLIEKFVLSKLHYCLINMLLTSCNILAAVNDKGHFVGHHCHWRMSLNLMNMEVNINKLISTLIY